MRRVPLRLALPWYLPGRRQPDSLGMGLTMVAHQWEVHGDGGSQYGHCEGYHWALAWLYGALDHLPGSGWGVLLTAGGSGWRAERDDDGEITWTRL